MARRASWWAGAAVVAVGLIGWSSSAPDASAPAQQTPEVTCDIDGDGDADVAILRQQFGGQYVDLLAGGADGPTYTEGPYVGNANSSLFEGVCADFDGDGYDDPVLAIRGTDADNGWVMTASGSEAGLDGDTELSGLSQGSGVTGLSGVGEDNDEFGDALAAGDLNGDGYDDLVIGVPSEALGSIRNAGMLHVVPGSASGLDADNELTLHQGKPGMAGSIEADDRFAQALAVGDFDGDGYDDLAIGVPDEDLGNVVAAGMVHIVPGSATGIDPSASTTFHQGSPGVIGAVERADGFGGQLVAADLDGDGYDDLVVASPGEALGNVAQAGLIHIVPGSASGLQPSAATTRHLGAAATGYDELGAELVVGDVTGDGIVDLVAVAPEHFLDLAERGALVLWAGSPAAMPAATPMIEPAPTAFQTLFTQPFARAIVAADLNGDGTTSLVTLNREFLVIRTFGDAANATDVTPNDTRAHFEGLAG